MINPLALLPSARRRDEVRGQRGVAVTDRLLASSAVDRDSAKIIAEAYLKNKGQSGEISQVVRYSEIQTRKPLVYGITDWDKHWVAYAASRLGVLESSTVVVIDDSSGEVLFAGSANDEG